MIDRRTFINTLSASALVTAVPNVAEGRAELPAPTIRSRISLNGEWEQRVAGKFYETIDVPSSRRPRGTYSLSRRFIVPRFRRRERVFVHFEAVTYWGQVSINNQKLGTMDPYVPHEFEFTEIAREGENEIDVVIADLVPFADGDAKTQIDFGIHPGFEAYGGIIRDVWVEVRPVSFVEEVRLAYKLTKDYRTCAARPRVTVSSRENAFAHVETVLYRNQTEVARQEKASQINAGSTALEFAFDIEDVSLWSPDTPNLYELIVRLKTESSDDSLSCRTGFREIRAVGREFFLNGKRLVLNGVCRHDMWKDQGFTLSRQQQDQDMRLVKALGCNFVRLVHYPHDRRIVELADEIGLLVSEEPGFWQTNFQTMDRRSIDLGFKILEATIRRD